MAVVPIDNHVRSDDAPAWTKYFRREKLTPGQLFFLHQSGEQLTKKELEKKENEKRSKLLMELKREQAWQSIVNAAEKAREHQLSLRLCIHGLGSLVLPTDVALCKCCFVCVGTSTAVCGHHFCFICRGKLTQFSSNFKLDSIRCVACSLPNGSGAILEELFRRHQ